MLGNIKMSNTYPLSNTKVEIFIWNNKIFITFATLICEN